MQALPAPRRSKLRKLPLTPKEMNYSVCISYTRNWGAIQTPDALVDDDHLNDRGFWIEVPHPALGRRFTIPVPLPYTFEVITIYDILCLP